MSDLPPEMVQALKDFGFSDDKLSEFSLKSELVMHLRITGDDFDTFYACLSRAYNSSNLVPRELIPSELSNDSFFLALGDIFPIFNRMIRSPPLTLGMIDAFMRGQNGPEV